MSIGIYKIENLLNHKKYIGLTNNIQRRRARHFTDLRCHRHDNSFLQKEFDRDRESNFSFSVEFEGENINDLSTDQIAKKGIFMSFQLPEEIPGISTMNFLKYAKNKVTGSCIYYFNGIRHGVYNDLLQHCTEHGRNEQHCIFKCISRTRHHGTACVYS